MACVGQKQLNQYPNSVNCGAVGAPSIGYTGALGKSTGYSQCDCINLPDEKLSKVGPLLTGKLKQNVLEDNKAFHKVVDDDYRFDHLKFVLRTDRKITPKIKPNCFPTGFDDGVFYFPIIDKTARDIADCTVDYISGVYSCGSGAGFFSRKGTAQLIEVTINGEKAENVKELNIGDKLIVGAKVTKTGNDKCIRFKLSPDSIEPKYDGITLNGTNDVPPLELTGSLKVAGRTGQVVAPGITYSLKSQTNQEPVVINVRAFDNPDPKDKSNNRTYSIDDRVIIDGIEVDFKEEKEQGNEKTKIKASDKTITVEKEGAKIEITNIDYASTQTGSYEYQRSITINAPQQVSQESQEKKVIVELFHLKDSADSYANNPDNCDLNDRIGEPRTYTIRVMQEKGADASKLGPLIQLTKPNQKSYNIGQPIQILARITHKTPIEKALLVIKDKNGIKVEEIELQRDGDNFEYTFDTNAKEAGKYSANIKATSRVETESNKGFEFELK